MTDRWTISWWEHTGRVAPSVDNGSSPIMRNIATGEEVSSRDMPIGACWAATGRSAEHYAKGADGLAVFCRVPDDHGAHTWHIDGRCSNCTLPDDKVHRCWVRHGTVGEAIHVDKGGVTCSAGAGSILTSGWHGFLDHGVLRP